MTFCKQGYCLEPILRGKKERERERKRKRKKEGEEEEAKVS